MSDIFISYSSKDRPWVERFAKTLETHGWSVWWDRNIPTGGSFNAVIRQELSAAKCAIVVWSEQSVESEWVQAEAAEAKKQDKYLPIKINESDIPLGFTQRTFQSLVDWEAGVDHAGFSQLLKDIERLAKRPPKRVEFGPIPWWKRVHPIWLVTAPVLMGSVVVVGLMLWSIPARVQVELTTERVEFVLGAKQSQDAFTLSGMVADSVGIENFEAITFAPSTIEVADPSLYQLKEDRYPDKAWRKLALAESELTVVANHLKHRSKVVLEGDGEPIKLDSIVAKPGARVSLETREKEKRQKKEERDKKDTKVKTEKREGVTIKVAGQNESILRPGRQFTFIADHVEIHGLKGLPFNQDDELTYRITLLDQPSRVMVKARSDELVLLPTFALGQSAHQVFGGVPVTTVDFTRQASEADGGRQTLVKGGARISALTSDGTITFPGYEHLLGTVSIKQDEAVGLEHLDGFTIQELSLTANRTGIHLRGEGMAKDIRTKSGQIPTQSRGLTALDALWHNARLEMFAAIVSAIFMYGLGAYRLLKEFKR
ncbi:MAG: toll/interleukin-1 receptor domain-containing protein [Nitrospira sp.]|nr:toll/interleukin-1 receptor domain-containing protein [Nitrospira sp.]